MMNKKLSYFLSHSAHSKRSAEVKWNSDALSAPLWHMCLNVLGLISSNLDSIYQCVYICLCVWSLWTVRGFFQSDLSPGISSAKRRGSLFLFHRKIEFSFTETINERSYTSACDSWDICTLWAHLLCYLWLVAVSSRLFCVLSIYTCSMGTSCARSTDDSGLSVLFPTENLN